MIKTPDIMGLAVDHHCAILCKRPGYLNLEKNGGCDILNKYPVPYLLVTIHVEGRTRI